MTTIGVLALQGDVREHLGSLRRLGVHAVRVRRPEEVDDVDGLVIPGGESTTMWKLARAFDVAEPLRKAIAGGLPVVGTCAGMIMLADRVVDGTADQGTFGGLDITVRRNAFGRQVDSFETELQVAGVGRSVHAVFIRAPWVEQVGPDVEVLARIGPSPEHGGAAGRIVAVRQGRLMATSFHPEIGDDPWLHRLFVEMVTAVAPGPHRN